jgi:putative intracellular protease/amidase
MSAKKTPWTSPGPIDQGSPAAAEARKGTAAANPVLSLAGGSASDQRTGAVVVAGKGAEHAQDNRSPAEIEADIEQTRDRLAGTLDELSERLSPRAVLRKADSAVRGAFTTEGGGIRKDRAAIVLGAFVSFAGGLVVLRRRRRRR